MEDEDLDGMSEEEMEEIAEELKDEVEEDDLEALPKKVRDAMSDEIKSSKQDGMSDADYDDIRKGRRSLESNVELRQLYKYCMVNYLYEQYPNKIFHLQMLGKSLLSLERFSEFLKRMVGEEEYNLCVKAMNKQGSLNRYIANLTSYLSSIASTLGSDGVGEKKRKGLNMVKKIIYDRTLSLSKMQDSLDGHIISAVMIMIQYSDLKHVPLPDRDILADSYRLSFDDEERHRMMR